MCVWRAGLGDDALRECVCVCVHQVGLELAHLTQTACALDVS